MSRVGPFRAVAPAALVILLGSFLCGPTWVSACAACAEAASQPRDHEPDSPGWQETLRLVREDFPDIPQMTTRHLAERLDADRQSVLLLDARSLEEYEVGHLGGAVHAGSLRAALDALSGHRPTQTVVVYCSVGYRSSQLAQRLRDRGVPDVYNLEGSIFRWANEGRAVYRGGARVHEVHPYDEDWGRLLKRHFWLD